MKDDIVIILIVCISMIVGALLGIALYVDVNPITPMDVYRGNITLEITYRDGIAVDSVVVWGKIKRE